MITLLVGMLLTLKCSTYINNKYSIASFDWSFFPSHREPHLQAIPTPREFVQYLLDLNPTSLQGRQFDVHFRPQWFLGYFCEADYNYIGRLETFQQDIDNIRRALNISEVIWQNKILNHCH